jgi:ParB family chromosome partitioning protein
MKKALGRGLSALIPDSYVNHLEKKENEKTVESPVNISVAEAFKESGFQLIGIDQIIANQDQPRHEFNPEEIEDLAASIKEKGILQPVLVKKTSMNQYMLICGERRWRAARLCGLSEVPAIVKDVADEQLLEWALIENIQRQDLNAIEEAEAYRKLAEDRKLSQDEIAKRVGKNRSTVTNMIRLLRLPEEIQKHLSNGQLSAGHARALLGLLTPEHQKQMARRVVEENLSVRQVEAIVNRSVAHKRKAKVARNLGPEIIQLEARLAQHFGTQVRIFARKSNKSGRIEIRYFSLDDLDRILERFGLPPSI